MRQLSRILLALLLLSLAAGPLGGAHTARATYPGSHNGRLAFGLRASGNMDIVTVLPNGRGLYRLTTAPSFDACAAYSPDGKQIAFCSNRSGNFEIWTMKANGTRQRQLTHTGGRLLFPDYSPDGQRVAFEGTFPGDTESDIFTMRIDGTDLRRLTAGPGDGALPAYSPDGTRVVFISGRSGIPQVWVMNADGTDPAHVRCPREDAGARLEPGRQPDRVRGHPAHLGDGRRWQRSAPAHPRTGRGVRAGVVAGRHQDRLHPVQQRHGKPVGARDGRGRQ